MQYFWDQTLYSLQYMNYNYLETRSVAEHFSTPGNSAGLPGPAKNVPPTYRSKSTQNDLEASQIKNDIIGHFGQRFESNNI